MIQRPFEMRSFSFPVIDAKLTGRKIKEECLRQGFTVRRLQSLLGLAAVQSIYDWYSGKTLPSLDNMLAISRILGIPMEGLLVSRDLEVMTQKKAFLCSALRKAIAYWKYLFRMKLYLQDSGCAKCCSEVLCEGSSF